MRWREGLEYWTGLICVVVYLGFVVWLVGTDDGGTAFRDIGRGILIAGVAVLGYITISLVWEQRRRQAQDERENEEWEASRMIYEIRIYYGDSTHLLFSTSMPADVAPIWVKAGCDLSAFNGSTTDELVPSVTEAIEDMRAHPEVYSAMDPANGWGDSVGCLEFLNQIREACGIFTNERVLISRVSPYFSEAREG